MEVAAKEVRPQVRVERLQALDPTFEAGSIHTARAELTNPTGKEFAYSVELYLGVMKAATSGVGTVSIPAGQSSYVDFTLTMPADEADYPVYLDIAVAGELIAHYQATENVTVIITPAITVGPITWV